MRTTQIFTSLIAIIFLASCGKKEEQPPQAAPAMPYPVVTIQKQAATTWQEYPANLEGQQNVEIRPKVNGFIQKIYVDEGQTVRRGQLLFKLETQALNQDASAAKATVRAAQVEVDRLKPLVDRGIISNVQLETAKARLAQVQSNYGSIAANIGYGTITSPVDGVVGSIPYREGSLVSSVMEQPLTTVSDTKVMRAYFSLNEKQLLQFNKTFKGGSTAEKLKNVPQVVLMLPDNTEYELKGKLATMNGLTDPSTGTTQFRAEFKNPEAILRSGSTGVIKLPVLQKDIILVPQSAVYEMQGKQMIYVVGKDNKVKALVIETNGTSDKDFIVTGGLNVGDRIVVEGASKLRDDMEIVPQPVSASDSTDVNTKK